MLGEQREGTGMTLDGTQAERLAKIKKAGVLVVPSLCHTDRVLETVGVIRATREEIVKHLGQPAVIRYYIYATGA